MRKRIAGVSLGVLVLASLGAMRDTLTLPVSAARMVGVTHATTQTTQGMVDRAQGFDNDGDYLAYTVNTPGGMFRAAITYRTEYGKGFQLTVDGLKYDGFFNPSKNFSQYDAGLVELPAGTAEIRIGGGWGHYEIAGLTLTPAEPPEPPRKPSVVLADSNATRPARQLFRDLVAGYGSYTLSGVYDFVDRAYIKQKTGSDVAVLGRDLIEYTPSRLEHGSQPGQMVENVIAAARQGRVVTLCWHWNAPTDLIDKTVTLPSGRTENEAWYFGFYTRATTFDVAKALDDEDSADYHLLLRDIDTISVQLKKFQSAGIPVLWRPLHEAEGGWFWWGAKGPKAYVKLWRLMFNRLTRYDHVNNLIWMYTSAGSPDWYPGDDVVDIVGADAYPKDNRDPLTGIWNTLMKQFGDRKMLALTEVGMVPDVERMRRHGVYWAFYNTWGGKLGPQGMTDEDLRARIPSEHVRADLPR